MTLDQIKQEAIREATQHNVTLLVVRDLMPDVPENEYGYCPEFGRSRLYPRSTVLGTAFPDGRYLEQTP
jgi:hypothetical protein